MNKEETIINYDDLKWEEKMLWSMREIHVTNRNSYTFKCRDSTIDMTIKDAGKLDGRGHIKPILLGTAGILQCFLET